MARRFPVTLALAVQYVSLVLYPALHDGNQFRGFVYSITFVGLGATFLAELALFRYRPSWGRVRQIRIHRAGAIGLLGSICNFVGVLFGSGAYGYGVTAGLKTASHYTVFLTPFEYWPEMGIALLLYGSQKVERRLASRLYLGGIVAVSIGTALKASAFGILYPLFLVLGVCAVLTGAAKMRYVLVGLVALIAIWPVAYGIRNQGRIAAGATDYAYASSADAEARIDFDQLMANAYLFHHSGAVISGVPSYALIVRTGLIPRAIDQGRPVIQTATLLNEASGGNGQSAETLTTFGDLWVLHGYGGLVIAQVAIGVVGGLLVRQRGPYPFVVLAGLIALVLGAESTFPDCIAAFLQFAVSAGLAFVVFRPTRAVRWSRSA